MQQPSVCLGIATRNRAKSLSQAINSALRQNVANLTIVVLDDASTDETSTLPAQFPQVTWVRHEIRTGYMAARNDLMTRTSFEYLVSLDDDAWFLSDDEIATAVDFLERNHLVAAIAFDILSPDRPTPRDRTEAVPTATFVGCGHVLRMAPIRNVGAYELTPGNYGGEEKDLCLRLLDSGYNVVRLPGVHVWHDKTPIGREAEVQYRSGVCNDLVLTLRRTPTTLLPVALIAKFFQHFSFAVRKRLVRPCVAGFRLFFYHFPEVMHSRSPVKLSTLRAYMRLARTT